MTTVSATPTKSLPTTMPALKKMESAPGLTFCSSVELPKMGPRDVLIRVTHAGICGTDRHIYEWDKWSQNRIPIGITTGHEFCGKIVRTGPAVTRVHVGDRVSAEGHIGCGKCEACRTGNAHICDAVEIFGIDCDGCFATYHKVPEENVWTVNEKIRDEVAAIFDPLGNAVHTVMTAGVSGKSVLITGVGIIGLMAVTVAKAAGASRILATDVDPKRLQLAKELGADEVYSGREPWVAAAKQATWGRGPQVLLEMSGHPQAIRDGFSALQPGGTAALLGIPPDDITLDLSNAIIFKGATVHGINGRRMFETWYQMERFVLSGRLNLDPIITHVIDMQDFESGFRMMQTGEAIKVVMKIPE